LLVSTRIVPFPPIASLAFTPRLSSAHSNCEAIPITVSKDASNFVSISTPRPSVCLISHTAFSIVACRQSASAVVDRRLAKDNRLRTRSVARRVVLNMLVTDSSTSFSSGPFMSRSDCPRMTVSRLLKSCATPAANNLRDSKRCCS
jgi:hypothetical protein